MRLPCSRPYCYRPRDARGLCHMHYQREKRLRERQWQGFKRPAHKCFDLATLGAVGWRVRS